MCAIGRPEPEGSGRELLERALGDLRAEWGIHFRAVAAVLRALASGRRVSQERLVSDSGLSHRSVAGVVRRLEPWLEGGPEGYRLLPVARSLVEASAGAGPDPEPDGPLARMTGLVDRGPARRRQLDHVAATPETCLQRARFLAGTYALANAHVLFLGDHDLTSLALTMLEPEARISVVDVDDRLLEYVDRCARELGHRVTCSFADLRLGLPRALHGSVDLAFTDPPYTPDGVRLFAARCCQALRPDERSRLLLCYGYGERQPALGYRVQQALQSLRLAFEAVHPHFNRYRGAQAIGSSSALYVLQPTSGTWRTVEREPAASSRIYSQGGMSLEAAPRRLPEQLEQAARSLAFDAGEPAALAGEGWTGEDAGDAMGLPGLWHLWERHAVAPPAHRPPLPDTVAVNLLDAPALTARLLLLNRCRRLVAVTTAEEAGRLVGAAASLAPLFQGAYELREVRRHAGGAVLEAVRRDEAVDGAAGIAAHLVRHPAAALGNALREALVDAAGAAGRPLTKNQARAAVARHEELAAHRDARTADLPEHLLARLAALLPALAAAVEEAVPAAGDAP